MRRLAIQGRPGKTGFLWGAGAGLVAFLALGILRGIVYGGFWGLMLAGVLSGTPVEPTLLNKGIVVAAMILGVGAAFVFFVGAGALLGLGIGTLYPLGGKALQGVHLKIRRVKAALSGLNGSRSPVHAEQDLYLRRGRAVGAVLGAAVYAAGGLVTGVLYGGAGGLIFANSFYGSPVPQTLIPRLMVGFGMILGAISVGTFLIVTGAVIGTLGGFVVRTVHRGVVRRVKKPTVPVEITHGR